MDEDRIAEERKSLAWVRDEMQKEGNQGGPVTSQEGEEEAS
jgi:hypothetical protein